MSVDPFNLCGLDDASETLSAQAYSWLPSYYDTLMDPNVYVSWLNMAEKHFGTLPFSPHLILDLGCGTGTLSCLLSQRGYDVVGVDVSCGMLQVAQEKAIALPDNRPLFLCQRMDELDLYGTVDAAVSSLDSVNYLSGKRQVLRALSRVHLFLRPGGLFLFDIVTPAHFRHLHGSNSVTRTENVFCVWQTHSDPPHHLAHHNVTGFVREGSLWRRFDERHRQITRTPDVWMDWLKEAGFVRISAHGDTPGTPPAPDARRVYLTAYKE